MSSATGRGTVPVDVGDGAVAVEASPPRFAAGPSHTGPPTPDRTRSGDATRLTQRRLSPRVGDAEVAAPSTTGTATAAARRADRGLFRGELLPLLLLGGAVAAAYVACLQVALRRREGRPD